MHEFDDVSERLGTVVGWLSAPFFAATSFVRGARTFHPCGEVFSARVTPCLSGTVLGAKLAGHAIVRLSTALWKNDREWIDALGCAIRFRASEVVSVSPAKSDQDLLFATIRHPWTMPFAPFATDTHDFLGNDYFAVSPFDVPGFGRGSLRMRPVGSSRVAGSKAGSRRERLELAVAEGEARLQIEVKRSHEAHWTPVAFVDLFAPLDIDQARLHFSPFQTGRGLMPRGFVHALRHGAYAASQAARPSASPARQARQWRRGDPLPIEALRDPWANRVSG